MAADEPGDTDRIELRIRRSCDWTYLVVGLSFFLLGIVVVPTGFADIRADDFDGLMRLAFSAVGPTGFQVMASLFAVVSGAVAIGAGWRLRDRAPGLVAQPAGISLHPSIRRRFLPWDEVDRIEITKGRPTRLRIKLKRRAISLYAPLSSGSIEVPLMVSGWSYREAERYVASMRAWKRKAR